MEKQSRVVFRNVGQLYFPQTRVECHYSLTPDHHWSSKDWIGLFEVGWSSVRDYYTYTWALVPEGYTKGTDVNYCALFQSSYLPRPSATEYQFVYVDEKGEVCACSRHFTFCAPKPLEELETMKEEDGEEELLLVVPKAQLLQSRLEECLKEQADLKEALEKATKEKETEQERSEEARKEWENEREAMRKEISELRDNLRNNCEVLERMEGKHQDVKYTQESLSSELNFLLAEKAESHQRIKDLEDEIRVLTDRGIEANTELERMKERMKKMSHQMKHEEEKIKSLQGENGSALVEVRGLHERLEASEHIAESLRRELRELGTQQSHTHTELHQARLQVAQLTLQLSEENLVLREERANWALERETNKQAAEIDKKKLQELSYEVQRKEEWLQEERMEREKLEVELGRERDCNRVLLSEAKREVQELKAILRKVQKESEQQQQDKQDLVNYIRQLERRLETASDTKSDVCTSISHGSSSEDDKASSETDSIHSEGDTPVSDAQDEKRLRLEPRADGDKPLILPGLFNPLLSELADSPMW